MKILILGCGGIGSWLIEELCLCIDQEQISDDVEITIADGDVVELKQRTYQNFKTEDTGMNKATALADRFTDFGITSINKRITKAKDLMSFDFIVSCVDNEISREMVINHCFIHKKDFLDLRATGKRIFANPKQKSKQENIKFVDGGDKKEYSCQEQRDLKLGKIQKGNKIVALIGVQQTLNYLRGQNNRAISLTI